MKHTRIKKSQIQRVAKQIVKEYQPKRIILFGSYAWGKPGPDSDVDLFIIKESAKRRIDRERDLRRKLFGNNFPALDLLIYTPEEVKKRMEIEDFFILDIVNNGKLLYAKK